MSRRKAVPTAGPRRPVKVIRIRTIPCSANHHQDCYRSSYSSGVVFRCCCPCHESGQMALNFSDPEVAGLPIAA